MQLAHQKRSITPVTPLSYLCHTLVISRFIPPLFSFHIPVILLSHPCHTPFIPLSYPCHTPVVLLSYPCHHPCPRRRYPPQGGSPLLPLSLSRHDSDRVSVVSRSAVGAVGATIPAPPRTASVFACVTTLTNTLLGVSVVGVAGGFSRAGCAVRNPWRYQTLYITRHLIFLDVWRYAICMVATLCCSPILYYTVL